MSKMEGMGRGEGKVIEDGMGSDGGGLGGR